MTTSYVPTTLFTGFFGVGKTTAIRSVLSRKPESENWAILVNEFGEVPIDQAAFQQEGNNTVTIREIPGGCMCCVMNVPMRVAITEILRRAKPHRLLIEPTGIGHPAGILDELRMPDFDGIVDVGAVICFVDPRFVGDPRIENVEIFRDQVHLADVLIASKIDLASGDDLKRYHAWAENLFPPKLIISQAEMGKIDMKLLDLKAYEKRSPLFPDLHAHEERTIPVDSAIPKPKNPISIENRAAGFQGCGWIFSCEDIFNQDELIDYLGKLGPKGMGSVERLKGVFRVGADWVLIDRVKNEVSFEPISYRRDSRLEIIFSKYDTIDWSDIETSLLLFIK